MEGVRIKNALQFNTAKTLKARLAKHAVSMAERLLGTELYFSLPHFLSEFGLENEDPLRIIKRLRDRSFASSRPWILPCPTDEPQLFRVSLGEDSGGSHFFDLNKALWAALGEYVERKLWRVSDEWYQQKIVRGSWKELAPRALDPRTIVGIPNVRRTQEQNLAITEETVFSWIPTKSLTTGEKVLTPLQPYSLRYWNDVREKKQPNEPMIREPITTGLATGQSNTEAVLRGSLEVIERDAFMITYLNRLSPPRLDLRALAADPHIGHILGRLSRYNLEPVVLLLPTDFSPVNVVAVAIFDHTGIGPALTMGAKADLNLHTAILGALTEAVSVRHSFRDVAPLPDDFPTAHIHRNERIRYWFKTDRLSHIEFIKQGPVKTITPIPPHIDRSDVGAFEIHCQEQLHIITNLLKKNACDMYWADLTTNTVRHESSLNVIFAMSPQLQPLFLRENLPETGGERLRSVPEKLGYQSAKEFNSVPHPFP